MKYKVGDTFFLDGQNFVCDQKVEIYKILKADKGVECDCYLCVCEEDNQCNGSFNHVYLKF